MTRDPILLQLETETLDDLLSRWHWWAKGTKVGRGHADHSTVTGDNYRPSRQRDDENGKLDDDLDARTCRTVDGCVRTLEDPYRTAIYMDARNICTGVAVWNSPRLPENRDERAAVLKAARGYLTIKLKAAGVM